MAARAIEQLRDLGVGQAVDQVVDCGVCKFRGHGPQRPLNHQLLLDIWTGRIGARGPFEPLATQALAIPFVAQAAQASVRGHAIQESGQGAASPELLRPLNQRKENVLCHFASVDLAAQDLPCTAKYRWGTTSVDKR